MQTACTRAGEVLARAALDNRDVDPRQRQLARQHQPRRAGSGYHHRMLGHRHTISVGPGLRTVIMRHDPRLARKPCGAHFVGRARIAGMIDVAVLGRVGIDLYPNQLRTPLREVRTYTRFVGGFAGNVATGLARLGLRPAIVSRVGPDPHGEFVRDFLSKEGVDVRFLAVDERLMTPPTFCEVWPPDNFPITFYRYPTAPDWQLAAEDFDGAEVAAAPF